MFTGLNRYVYTPIAALALWAVVLAVSPATATAQATHQKQGQQETAVVAPGDTLWSISAEWLGPDATAQQVADGVERIYALNRNKIGADPNLIFAGQRLVVPSAVERGAPGSGSGSAARTRGSSQAAVPTAPSSPSHAASSGSADRAAEAALAEAHREPSQSAHARPEAAALPEAAQATPTPGVRALSPNDPAPSLAQSVASEARSSLSSLVAEVGGALPRGEYSERKLLGSALLGMSSVLAIMLVLYVAGVLWGPRYAERQARERRVRRYAETRAQARPVFGHANVNYLLARDMLFWESGQWKRGKSISRSPLSSYSAPLHELPESRTPVAHTANGSANGSANGELLSDAIRKIARARKQLRSRQLKAKRPRRARANVGTRGAPLERSVHRQPISGAKRARALRRTGGRK